jgi:hypothetical protein
MRLGRKIKDQVNNIKPELLKRCTFKVWFSRGRNGNPMARICLPQTPFATASRLVLSLLSGFVFLACCATSAKATGPLSVGSINPRFFVDSTGKAIYLTGVHLNNSLIDRSDKAVLDFTSYLDFLQKYEHNFIRLWAWEQTAWTHESTAKIIFDPMANFNSCVDTIVGGGAIYCYGVRAVGSIEVSSYNNETCPVAS